MNPDRAGIWASARSVDSDWLSADTLRYYERRGLLGRIARNGGGQRRYGAQDVARPAVRPARRPWISACKRLASCWRCATRGGDVRAGCADPYREQAERHRQRIEALTRLRDELSELVRRCHASAGDCPIIAHGKTTGGRS